MADIIHRTSLPSQIQFHPAIPLDPSSYEAVYNTLSFVNEEMKKKSMCCTSLTFDQPLYWKAKEVKANKSLEFNLPEAGWFSPTDEFSQSWLQVNGGCRSKRTLK